jgi:hypothetical protein
MPLPGHFSAEIYNGQAGLTEHGSTPVTAITVAPTVSVGATVDGWALRWPMRFLALRSALGPCCGAPRASLDPAAFLAVS